MINQLYKRLYKRASIFKALAETELDPALMEHIETLIIDAYFDITEGKTDEPVAIGKIRDALPGIAKDDFNAAMMLSLLGRPGVILYPEDNPQRLRGDPELREGVLYLNGVPKHWFKLEGRLFQRQSPTPELEERFQRQSPTPESGAASTQNSEEMEPDSVSIEDIIIDTYFDITEGKTDEPVAIGKIRDVLPGIAKDDLNAAMLSMLGRPGVIFYPEDNPQRLRDNPELREGVLYLNGVPKHWIKLEGLRFR